MLEFFAVVWMTSQGSAQDFHASGKGLAPNFSVKNPSHLNFVLQVGRRGGTATGYEYHGFVPPSHLVLLVSLSREAGVHSVRAYMT